MKQFNSLQQRATLFNIIEAFNANLLCDSNARPIKITEKPS